MKDSRKIISAYDRFVPYRMLQLLGKNDITEIKLGDQVEKRLTVLFTDIRDFTSLSESMTPQENFNFVNSYLSQMAPLISVHDGIIDKYIGDAIMAIFPGSAKDAFDCSLSILKQLRIYNEGRSRAGYRQIDIGIGLNTGLAMVGTVGGYKRMDSTIISDAVNLCSRIESLTKAYKSELLISDATYGDLGEDQRKHCRFIDRVLVKGKLKPQLIYDVYAGDPPELRMQKENRRDLFEEAVANYHYSNIETAADLFSKCLEDNYIDMPAQVYLERCKRYSDTGFLDTSGDLQDRISWGDVFLLGIEQIDKQHHELVDGSLALIEAVEQDATPEAVERITLEIAEKAKQHFATEEKLMLEVDYTMYELHKRQHTSLTDAFPKLADTLSDSAKSKIYKMFKVQVFLIDWLVNHTLKDDKHFGKFFAYAKG